jgi:hypothetical protein
MALSISVAVGFIVKACSSPELIETFGEKSEWSTLQAIELQNRNAALNAPVIRSMHDREVLGVRVATVLQANAYGTIRYPSLPG